MINRRIETERLVLRPYKHRDLDNLFAIRGRPDVVRYLYQEAQSREEVAAARDDSVSFLIINSGPGVDVIEQHLYGVEHTLRQKRASDEDVAQARSYMHEIHAAAIRAVPYEEFVTTVMEPARGTPGFECFGEVGPGLWAFLVLNLREPYDPVQSLRQITCPVLAIFGERDTLVPVAKSVRIFEETLAKAGNEDATIQVFPGADHRITVGEPPRFAGGYLDTMSEWLREQVG